MPPTGHPGSGSPRARDVKRRSHVSKKGRLVTVRVLTKTGPRRYKVRASRLAQEYRPVFTRETKGVSTYQLRKGTRLFIPQRRVLEVMVYGLARDKASKKYAFLPEQEWVFHFRPRVNPDRVVEIILKEFADANLVLVDTDDGGYRPFTIAAQVVDSTDADILTLWQLPEVVRDKIGQLDWTKE